MLNFPTDFFDDEVRDGFYVNGKMKRFWASQLEILADIDRICRKHGITYYAECGTLLGAVRHHGFIPWDDDMDITMKRKDYQRFINIAKEELGGRYHLVNYRNNDDYWDVMTRVINTENITYEADFLEKFHDSPYISGVDIFPMDYLPKDDEDKQVQKELIVYVKTVADTIAGGELTDEEAENLLVTVEALTAREIDRDKPIRDQLYDIVIGLYAMYDESEADEIVQMGIWSEGRGTNYPKEWYDHAVYIPFENIEIPVPLQYDALLKAKYGDYTRIVKAGSTHGYPLYLQQDEHLEEYNIKYPKYMYSPETANITRKSGAKDEIAQKADNLLGLFKNATMQLPHILEIGQSAVALDILNQCQDGAISLGNMIEQLVGNEHPTIKHIEEYCELIFQVYQAIAQSAEFEPAAVCEILLEQLAVVEDSIQCDVINRREVVLCPYKASQWKYLEKTWMELSTDPNVDLYVVPIPYYFKDVYGNFRGEPVYEGDKFPENVAITHFNDYNFEVHHPDAIYIQNPNDAYSFVSSVHPFFYSDNIKQFTDKLIYIPGFCLDGFDINNERDMSTTDSFVTVPGVANADIVYVESEYIKNIYVKALSKWAGEGTKTLWEQKIYVNESLYKINDDNTKQIITACPDEWKYILYKPDGSLKKVILYSNSIGTMLDFGEQMLNKLEENLALFKENSDDIALLWRPDILIGYTLKTINPQLWEKYKSICDRYIRDGWGIYDDSDDAGRAVELCDAYYGDGSSMTQPVRLKKKPVMIQKVDIG